MRLFDMKQGTIEFWVKRLWDDRLTSTPRVTFLTNGLLRAWSPWRLPLDQWAHVAVVWRPFKRDPTVTCVHVYVNGLDQAYYRSTWWQGYGTRPFTLSGDSNWLREFISQAPMGTAYLLDEIRISLVPRYANLDVTFGPQQTFNPLRFEPPSEPFQSDQQTTLLFHLDGDLKDKAHWSGPPFEGQVVGSRAIP